MRRTSRNSVLTGIVLAAAALSGCGGGGPAASNPTSPGVDTTPETATPSGVPAPATAPAPSTPHDPTSDVVDDAAAWRAVSLVEELRVLDAPGGDVIATLPATSAFDTPTVAGVIDRTPGWVQVMVNGRPNGLTGWVDATSVRVEPLTVELHVDLESRTLRLVDDGVVTDEWPVAIGRPDRPTPTGRYFVTDKLATGDPGSVWGAHALGISAYSEVLHEFIGGIGQIGIHGTNDPSSIGRDVSSGCIRLPNEVIDELVTWLPVGTPVVIR